MIIAVGFGVALSRGMVYGQRQQGSQHDCRVHNQAEVLAEFAKPGSFNANGPSRLSRGSTRPYYIEPVDPDLKTAQAARKWQFAKPDGSWPDVSECNKSPELVFSWEA